jgi:hypothetical protein
MKRTTVFLDEPLLRRLKRKAQTDGKSFAQCVREAVAAYLEQPRGTRPLPSITGMFKGGPPYDTSERVDEILRETLGRKDPHS